MFISHLFILITEKANNRDFFYERYQHPIITNKRFFKKKNLILIFV